MSDLTDKDKHLASLREQVTQSCDVCGKPVKVHAVSPSECLCSEECAEKHYFC